MRRAYHWHTRTPDEDQGEREDQTDLVRDIFLHTALDFDFTFNSDGRVHWCMRRSSQRSLQRAVGTHRRARPGPVGSAGARSKSLYGGSVLDGAKALDWDLTSEGVTNGGSVLIFVNTLHNQ